MIIMIVVLLRTIAISTKLALTNGNTMSNNDSSNNNSNNNNSNTLNYNTLLMIASGKLKSAYQGKPHIGSSET